MRATVAFSILGLATAVSASVLEARACADNCARALKNTAKPGTAVASADCSAFMVSTVTPATVTSTTTLTFSTILTSVLGVTQTDTIHGTATETALLPAVTVTTTLPVVFKRAVTTLPLYASACSGTVAYSSACSCIGVRASVVTAPTPTSVSTVFATVPYTTQPVTSTVTTTAVTVVDGTTTQSVAATATVSIKPERKFIMQVADAEDSTLVGLFIGACSGPLDFTEDEDEALVLQVQYDTGYLYDGTETGYVVAPVDDLFGSLYLGVQWYQERLACSHDSLNILSCSSPRGRHLFADYEDTLGWAESAEQVHHFGKTLVTLRVIFQE